MIDETWNRGVLECPHCHHKDSEAHELGDGGEGCGRTECGSCKKEFIWIRNISVSYIGKQIKEESK